MKLKFVLFQFFFLLAVFATHAQQDSLSISSKTTTEKEIQQKENEPYNALAPSKAAFYSAILPGLGQAYNGSYWKIPIAYGGMATGIYFYLKNDREYNKYRDAYKNRLAGRPDQFEGRIATNGLIRAQEFYQKNKEISIMVTVGVYILNIVDANVEAHLRQFNVNEDLSFRPNMDYDALRGKTNYGLTLNYSF
ncbi:hypothetical protein C7S20_12160 [Christiangramia fulva]|uniref:DUF5683 domain-containing protein n=1 Tax=Christiangramia fulva TaxID=2126553 RepID=A0A2R3Z6N8_9FLAO|nr:DUF5683 domain-containing protein [Christiangramia fulva]AVR45946.1 hypothetical protein C7S20_12160 [Christiangramia fulva]